MYPIEIRPRDIHRAPPNTDASLFYPGVPGKRHSWKALHFNSSNESELKQELQIIITYPDNTFYTYRYLSLNSFGTLQFDCHAPVGCSVEFKIITKGNGRPYIAVIGKDFDRGILLAPTDINVAFGGSGNNVLQYPPESNKAHSLSRIHAAYLSETGFWFAGIVNVQFYNEDTNDAINYIHNILDRDDIELNIRGPKGYRMTISLVESGFDSYLNVIGYELLS